jgi:hypothetical protein
MASSLALRAGPHALAILRERGLRAADVDVIPGASGGAKWLALAGIDRFLFGELLRQPRERPLHLIGSSIGSWRMACLAQRDPVAALALEPNDRPHRVRRSGRRVASIECVARPDEIEMGPLRQKNPGGIRERCRNSGERGTNRVEGFDLPSVPGMIRFLGELRLR